MTTLQAYQTVIFAALLGIIIVGCDSSPAVSPSTIDGEYVVERYDFQPEGFNIVVNVRDSLERLDMEVFAEDREFLIRYRFSEESTARIRGSFSMQRNSVQFSVEQGDPTQILLPAESFSMRVRDGGDVLTLDADREGVDLRPYGIGQRHIDGRLRVRMARD